MMSQVHLDHRIYFFHFLFLAFNDKFFSYNMDTNSSNFTQTNDHDQIVLDEERVYLDYNATTPLDPEVRKAIKVSIDEDWGNPSSGKWL